MKIRSLAASTALAAGLALSSTASAQFGFVTNQSGTFVDITATGTLLGSGDDESFQFTVPANCANTAFPQGTIRICTNGHAGYGAVDTQYNNATLPATFAYSGNVACLFWDDLNATTEGHSGAVYAQVIGDTLIVQWNEMDHYFTSPNSITFQLQIFGGSSGPGGAKAQYLYRNMDTGDGNANGASATIGYQFTPGNAVQFAYNQAGSVQAGTVLSLMQTSPLGACCASDGTCSVSTPAACTGAGGVYRGDNSACATANCPAPAGMFIEQGDAGELPGTAANVSTQSGSLTTIRGTLSAGDADMYRINVCDAANFTAATAGTSTTIDTELMIFKADGTGVAFNDDEVGGTSLQSRISSQFVAPLGNGTYYLAVCQFSRLPARSGSTIWINDGITFPYRSERAPDGPGAPGPVTDWNTGTGTGGAYVISLTGACFNSQACYANCDGSTIAPILNVNDFICFQTKYAAGDPYANCDGSTIAPILNVNDFICFQTKYAAGCP